ncbi:acylphosphatase [Bacillus sp. FJAT-50079]|uniref:acylphosphatase n=1 Tax=Bacillus sp. FJAT-50079 TaxID=2833577 RepID=UPI001BC9A21C|nr:acylphosphatase [Bacillus sp. FJAT-50079]MBS4209891.1 acylphosphatase [Bacillus sp. FJAT-50079]
MKNVCAIHLLVHGRVQGVGFRFSTQQLAMEHHIKGWVKNTMDGTVEIAAEGEKTNVDNFIKALQTSPNLFARVDQIDVAPIDHLQGFRSFQVKY